MATVEEVVQTAIDQDVILQGAIARGIVNRKAVATWLKQNRSIDASLDAIYDAVDEYEPDGDGWSARMAWEALNGRAPQRFKPVTALTLDRTEGSFRSLGGLFGSDAFPYQTDYRIVPSEGAVVVIVDDKKLDAAIEAIGAEFVVDQQRDLTQIEIVPRHRDPTALTEDSADGWVLASVAMALSSAGIDIHYAANGATGHYIVVSEDQDAEACRLLQELLINPSLEELEE